MGLKDRNGVRDRGCEGEKVGGGELWAGLTSNTLLPGHAVAPSPPRATVAGLHIRRVGRGRPGRTLPQLHRRRGRPTPGPLAL